MLCYFVSFGFQLNIIILAFELLQEKIKHLLLKEVGTYAGDDSRQPSKHGLEQEFQQDSEAP